MNLKKLIFNKRTKKKLKSNSSNEKSNKLKFSITKQFKVQIIQTKSGIKTK